MHTVFTRAFSKLAIAGGVLAMTASGCSNQTTTFPTVTTKYAFLQNISIPGVPPAGGWSNGFGVTDQTDGLYLLTDRSTAAVDVISLSTMSFVRFAGQGSFVGNRTSPKNAAGPNSITYTGNGTAFASDGNSNIVVVNVLTGATLGNVVIPNTGKTANRVDLLGYDPTDNVVLAGNDASSPSPVLTFVSTIAPYPVLGQIVLTTATAGVEQPTYDPAQGVFLVSIPATKANPGGEVDVISPTTRAITKVYPIGNNCGPTGTALGQDENLAVSCSNLPVGSLIINATNGATIATIPVANGCDQVTYNPGDNRFFYACSHPSTPIVAIVDAGTGSLVTTITTSSSANTVSVDASTNRVYIPERSAKTEPIGVDVFSYQ